MTTRARVCWATPLVGIGLMLVGCSIDDSSNDADTTPAASTNRVQSAETNGTEPAPSAGVDVSGSWVLSASGNVLDAWTMSQSGASVQGANQDGRRIVGSVSGDQFIADLLPGGGEPTFSINATVSGDSMSGTASSASGVNSFTAERVVD